MDYKNSHKLRVIQPVFELEIYIIKEKMLYVQIFVFQKGKNRNGFKSKALKKISKVEIKK